MDILIVKGDLRDEYKRKDDLWRRFYVRLLTTYANFVWKYNALVLYPLTIDIRLGNMKFYYFKYGIGYVKRRIDSYNQTLGHRLEGRNVDINTKEFFIDTILTDKDQISDQLDDEMSKYMAENY